MMADSRRLGGREGSYGSFCLERAAPRRLMHLSNSFLFNFSKFNCSVLLIRRNLGRIPSKRDLRLQVFFLSNTATVCTLGPVRGVFRRKVHLPGEGYLHKEVANQPENSTAQVTSQLCGVAYTGGQVYTLRVLISTRYSNVLLLWFFSLKKMRFVREG